MSRLTRSLPQAVLYLTSMDYKRIVALLDQLVDEVGEDENHPLASLMEALSVLIEKYEAEHVPELTAN